MSKLPPSKAELARRAWEQMFQFLMRTAPERAKSLGSRGLTPNDSRALMTLDQTEGRTMRSLAEAWECDASNATWVVDRLERLGLAERTADPEDRRVKRVVLTRKGVSTKAELMDEFSIPPAALETLSRADLDALVAILEKLPAS